MVYDIIRDTNGMGSVCSLDNFRFSCAGCMRGRRSDTLHFQYSIFKAPLTFNASAAFLAVWYILIYRLLINRGAIGINHFLHLNFQSLCLFSLTRSVHRLFFYSYFNLATSTKDVTN